MQTPWRRSSMPTPMLPTPNDNSSNANATAWCVMPNGNGNGSNVKPPHGWLFYFLKKDNVKQDIFHFAFVTVVCLLCRVSGVLAPARPLPGGDAPLPLWLNPVDCFLESIFLEVEFQKGPGLMLISCKKSTNFWKVRIPCRVIDSKNDSPVSSKLDWIILYSKLPFTYNT